ncbi:MAG: hypothetical protein IIT37_08270, partial [Bacteroidales bacterium]|nr:hypothetical protein [Bacteroidales bacterium]
MGRIHHGRRIVGGKRNEERGERREERGTRKSTNQKSTNQQIKNQQVNKSTNKYEKVFVYNFD